MTFDPNYATNGHFYVSYTTDNGGIYDSGVSHIGRFTVSATDPNFTDPSTEVTVITVDQPFNDHNFDWIGFSNRSGDDGNLYICSGDGGGYCDRGEGHVSGGNGQSTETLLAKILRIHIEDDGTYTIPPNNPFAGQPPPVKQEIFCYGFSEPFPGQLRSPKWRYANWRRGGSITAKRWTCRATLNPGGGENYGWRIREGSIQSTCDQRPKPLDAVDPILDYAHDTTGSCVIGGYVYRGKKVRALHNLYVFADCFGPGLTNFLGKVWTLRYHDGVASDFMDITSQLFPTRVGGYTLNALTSLGEDANGELYLVDEDVAGGTGVGNVYKIVRSQ